MGRGVRDGPENVGVGWGGGVKNGQAGKKDF